MKEIIKSIQEFMQIKFDELKLNMKPILTVDDLSKYLDYSPEYIYKMTHNREIPYYKPNGKKLYFKRDEIDEWVLSNKVFTQDELRAESRRIGRKNK